MSFKDEIDKQKAAEDTDVQMLALIKGDLFRQEYSKSQSQDTTQHYSELRSRLKSSM